MQDRVGIHRAKIIKAFFRASNIELMEWPPYSPDLNPIKNLWALLKIWIYQDHLELEHAPNTDDTLDQLMDAAVEAWNTLGNEILCNLSDRMPNHVKAVIDANGWFTKY
jgi:transposase